MLPALGAAILVNSLSFLIQNRCVRTQPKRALVREQFAESRFALRFYGDNLTVAIARCISGFYPWIVVVFACASDPILFWLLPYHLLVGLPLGKLIQRHLNSI